MKNAIKRRQAAEMAGVCDRKINSLIENEGFPQPIKVGGQDLWIDTEVEAWIDGKIAERDAVAVAGGAE